MQPLADRIRPQTLKDFVGQPHLVGPGKPIHQAIKQGRIHSMIFWGPPGSGKTTLAQIIANAIKAQFFHLSAVSAGKSDIKKIIDSIRVKPSAQQELTPGNLLNLPKSVSSVLFLDEIHRFNKAQQDYLLPFVETGTLTLIGATTENPSFEVISPLLSRCQVYVLDSLSGKELRQIIHRGIKHLGGGRMDSPEVGKDAIEFLIQFANGDARQALNLLENTVKLYGRKRPDLRPPGRTGRVLKPSISVSDLKTTLQSKFLQYDKGGEEHYNTISAFIKSMRASNPDAALYYLARMVDTGEDPLFIARRMVVFASEDIGMAQPTALVVANEVFRACETIGYPECAINLAHGVVYLAKAPKNRAAYDGLRAAQKDVKDFGNLPIPLNLRNAPTKLMKDLGYGSGYEPYTKESLLPHKIKGKKYYHE
ncbi:MAG: replication-associated recombination protein A [Candidatus Chisholmbacteria bacterium]|nr:replication-associated recombination protein A [Candidatus Chisholmbacteria bacterium]